MRYYTDCREVPSVTNCTVAIFADSPDELIDASIQHMVANHDHKDTKDLRDKVREAMHETEEDLAAS